MLLHNLAQFAMLLAEEEAHEEAHGGVLTQMFVKLTGLGAEWVMWVLVLLSLVSVTFIVDRILYYKKIKMDEETSTQLEAGLREGNLNAVWQVVQTSEAIECTIISEGLQAVNRGSHACSEAMLGAKARERLLLDNRLSIIATIGSNAPFVGLLGTVIGIIKAAGAMTKPGGGGTNAVMGEVFEALVATAIGLFVAIPAIAMYNMFTRKVKTTMANVDSYAHMLLSHVSGHKPTGNPTGAAPAAGTATAQAARPAAAAAAAPAAR